MDLRPLRLRGVSLGIAIASAIAVLIQVQPTLRVFGQETRFAGSDPVVGAVALAAAVGLMTGRYPFGIWRGLWIWAGLAAMTLVLAVSFAIGYAAMGGLSSWALQNRISGWAVLVAYVLCGGILGFAYGPRAIEAFLEIFVIVGSLVAAFGSGAILLVSLGLSTWLPFADAQLRGLVANPNAFGLLAVLALTAVWLVPLRGKEPLRGPLAALWSAAAYLSFSRATWIGCVVAVVALFALRRLRWRPALLWMCVPAASVAALIALGAVGPIVSSKWEGVVKAGASNAVPDPGVTGRLRLAEAALDLWQSSPIFGAGLGVHWHREQAANPDHPLLQHSTPLWLLAETGIFGLAIFAAFTAYALRLLLHARRAAAGRACLIEDAAIVYICAFAVVSLFHDILYQRILWVVLGFALAATHAARPPPHSMHG